MACSWHAANVEVEPTAALALALPCREEKCDVKLRWVAGGALQLQPIRGLSVNEAQMSQTPLADHGQTVTVTVRVMATSRSLSRSRPTL